MLMIIIFTRGLKALEWLSGRITVNRGPYAFTPLDSTGLNQSGDDSDYRPNLLISIFKWQVADLPPMNFSIA
jgi:hypothetical protein